MSSVSASLIGLRDMDTKIAQMLRVKLFCEEHGVSYPSEVNEFFGSLVTESAALIREEMVEIMLVGIDADGINEWETTIPYEEVRGSNMERCVSINIADIPEDIKSLELKMSWE